VHAVFVLVSTVPHIVLATIASAAAAVSVVALAIAEHLRCGCSHCIVIATIMASLWLHYCGHIIVVAVIV
jgi:hypothetical protein